MSICTKCNNTYYSKKCDCTKTTYTTKRKDFKIPSIKTPSTKTILLTIIALSVAIMAFFTIIEKYYTYQENKKIAKLLYGTDDFNKIEKINEKIMENSKKMIEKNRKMIENLKKLYSPQ